MSDQTLWAGAEFMAELLRRFPELEGVQDPDVTGLIHCEMGWFSSKTSTAIESREFRLVRNHFEFIDDALTRASDALENAILVSYLENVFGLNTENTVTARNFLTPRLSAPAIEMEGHFIAKVVGALPPIGVRPEPQLAVELDARIIAMSKPVRPHHL
jgi:hypothetical protein